MQDIHDLSYQELESFLNQLGEQSFRAGQIFEWLYQKAVLHFDEMSNLPSALKEGIKKYFFLSPLTCSRSHLSTDQTRKFLFTLADGENIETVLIPAKKRATVCVSTQAGCKFSCSFCASGIGGWKRNLTTGEILGQILYVKAHVPDLSVTHVVFMGVGEPLDNYDNVLKAVRTINDSQGMNIAARRITISTCGVIPRIRQLAREGIQIELAISLHGYDNASRNTLMPVNRRYPFDDLMAACREYVKETNRQITFEYILIKDVTCTEKAVPALKNAFKSIICKMNLIPFNPVTEFGYKTPSRREILRFKDRLQAAGIHATVRLPRGTDVAAACGQLRHAEK